MIDIRLLHGQVREDEAAVHLVEELASGGELFDRIIELGHFSEKEAVHLVRGLPAPEGQTPHTLAEVFK